MPTSSLQGKTVRELQDLAAETPATRSHAPKKSISRAARLHLIDLLSRWSASGLALITGVSIYLAVTVGRTYPARAAAWAAMMLCALWVCRRLRNEYRTGNAISSRPFRWRASYTSCLSVLGVVLASAPILLIPANAPTPMFLQVASLMVFAALGAAMLHTAHFASAAAIAVPASILAIMAGLRSGDPTLILAGAMAALMSITAIYAAYSIISKKARQMHPRTTFLRKGATNWENLDENTDPGAQNTPAKASQI